MKTRLAHVQAALYFALILSGSRSYGQKAYSGYGPETTSKETLSKYAPEPLPASISNRIQNFLDIRSPGAGLLDPLGKRLFFSWKVTGVTQVWRLDKPLGFPIQMTGGEDSTNVFDISPDGKWLVLSRDINGQENPGIYLQSTQGGPLKLVQHKPKVQSQPSFFLDDSRWLYYRSNDIKPDSYAIYRYDIKNETRELLLELEGHWGIADHLPNGTLLLYKAKGSVWSEFYEWNPQTKAMTPVIGQNENEDYQVRYGAKPGEFIVSTPKFGEFRRLYSFKNAKFTSLSPVMNFDVDDFAIDQSRQHLIYTINEDGRLRLKALNARNYKAIKLPAFKDADQVNPGYMTTNGQQMVISVMTAKEPRSSYSYDWKTQKLTKWVIPSAPEIDLNSFAVAKLEYYPARDGTQIPMFVRRPQNCKEPCPVVVHFHGGPEGQSKPGFSVYAQMLVDAGFIFVEPNVRGSDGYGKTWFFADNGPRRLDVIADIEDCAKYIREHWAKNGVAPKIGVMGWSYGGYSTLMAMTRFAGAYDAGVAIVGISNLLTFLNNTAPYRRALRISEYGDPEKDKEALIALSPITYLDRVKAPLLIIQGANDPRVPVGEAIQIQEALQARKISSQLIIFPDEGHGSQKRSNQVLELGHLIQFFEKYLISQETK